VWIETGKAEGNRERIVEGGGSANRRVDKSNRGKDTADVRCMRKKQQKGHGEESATGSTGVKQNARKQARRINSTPPPLRRTSGSSPPSGWEVLFNLFLDELRGSRNGGFLDDILYSGCLWAVDLDGRRELNGCWNGCDTGIRRRRSAKYW